MVQQQTDQVRTWWYVTGAIQIAGLKAYLGQDYDTLLCVDIVCHGVPSPKVWKEYLEWQEKRKHKKLLQQIFGIKENMDGKDI